MEKTVPIQDSLGEEWGNVFTDIFARPIEKPRSARVTGIVCKTLGLAFWRLLETFKQSNSMCFV